MSIKKVLTIAAAAAALTALSIPAMAESTLYGSARMATFYNFADLKGKDSSGFDEHLQANSRLGFRANNGAVGGVAELGASAAATTGNGISLRLLYGTWDFGSGVLTVGQDYNSYYSFTEQVHGDDNNMNGYGSLWDTRQAQIRVNLKNGLYFAAITPTGNVSGTTTGTNAENTSPNNKMYLPKLNLGYKGKAGTFNYNVGVVGQTLENSYKEQITAILGYVQGRAAFGATSVLASFSYAQNAGNMGFSGRASATGTTDIVNANGFEGFLQVGQRFSDTLSANVGFGYTADKYDTSGAKYDDKMLIFVNAPITLAKNVTVTPEFSYYDQLDKNGATEDSKSYALGAKWQINF